MRVLIIHPNMSFLGGAEVVVIKLATHLTKKGVENAVLTLSLSKEIFDVYKEIYFITPAERYDFKWRYSPLDKTVGIINKVFILKKMIARIIDSYDVVNVHNFPAHWAMVFNRKKPVVWMCNEPPDLWANIKSSSFWRIYQKAGVFMDKSIVSRYIDQYCVADEFNFQRAVQRYDKIPHIINYGIDYEFFSTVNEKGHREFYNLNNNCFLLLQVGLVSPQKNQLESIKVVEKLRFEIPNIKLILAGSTEGQYYQELKKYIFEKNLDKYIIFTGHLSKEKTRDLYHACDVALFPVKVQGGWLAPFEALCVSKPIVMSTTMGAASIIQREKIGIVTNDFTEAVRNIYLQPSMYKNMTTKGKNWVANNLSWEKFTECMLEVFEKAYTDKKKGDK